MCFFLSIKVLTRLFALHDFKLAMKYDSKASLEGTFTLLIVGRLNVHLQHAK